MDDSTEDSPRQTISGRGLMKSVALTLAGAVIVTVLFIMPAEFGVDPSGVGARLGLTSLDGTAAAADVGGAPTKLLVGEFPGLPTEFDEYDPEVMGDPFSRTHDAPFRSETRVIRLEEFEQVEVKATMQQGDALVYTWTLSGGDTVYTDFHADPGENAAYPEGYWVRYLESETAAATGSIVAPFDGNHGWYWLNILEEPVEITLEVHGFYDSLDEVMRSFQ